MNIVPNAFRFGGYPTDHLLGILPDAESVEQLDSALLATGFPPPAVKVFVGEEGVQQFGGGHQGLRSWFEELSRTVSGTSEGRADYLDALTSGQYVVAVDLHGRGGEKRTVADLFKAAQAHDINFLGRLMVDALD